VADLSRLRVTEMDYTEFKVGVGMRLPGCCLDGDLWLSLPWITLAQNWRWCQRVNGPLLESIVESIGDNHRTQREQAIEVLHRIAISAY